MDIIQQSLQLALEDQRPTVDDVDVTPSEKERQESHILPELGDAVEEGKYMQVLYTTEGRVQLDLLNITLDGASEFSSSTHGRTRGRKLKSDLPPPHELAESPKFKLYIYSCKLCSYKCNARKELSVHKASEHGSGPKRGRGGGRGAPSHSRARAVPSATPRTRR